MGCAMPKTREIKRVGIIGSGTMGVGIAAHLANCGVPSLLLKMTPVKRSGREDEGDPFTAEKRAILLKTKPSAIYDKTVLDLIEFGSMDANAGALADCDWICETVKEDLSAKKEVFAKVALHRKPGSIVSTNTSGIQIAGMAEWMAPEMRSHFLGTHFFNPPRYLKLLELVPGPDTDREVIDTMARFGENVMGKGVVLAKDTPNFVANRTLIFMLQCTLHEMTQAGLRMEEVDALTGVLVGHASSATFRTVDLVGLDTIAHVVANVYTGCPNDERHDMFVLPDWVSAMVQKEYYGEKSGGGFYKKTAEKDGTGKSIVLSVDPETLEYRPQIHPQFDCVSAAKRVESIVEKVRIMHSATDRGSEFVWKVFSNSAVYAGNRIPEIAGDIVSIDSALKWGFGWELGLFEVWDILGFEDVCKRMVSDGLELPPIAKKMLDAGVKSFYNQDAQGRKCHFDLGRGTYHTPEANPNILLLNDVKLKHGVIKENASASLLDLGDGILCLEFHSKMNTIDMAIGEILDAGIDLVNIGKFDGLVIGNQGPHFSAGANLFLVVQSIKKKNWEKLRWMINEFQRANMSIRFCRGPVVAAPHHFTFGGGLEMSQHSARVVVAGETYGGLPEIGLGLVPGAGGIKEMLRRALAHTPDSLEEGNPFPYVRRAFESICMAKISTSGTELLDLGYLAEQDVVLCESFDHQIKRAKDICLSLVVGGYKPPRYARLTALGEPVRSAFRAALYNLQLGGFVSAHDVDIAMRVAHVMTGGDRWPGTKMTEHDVLELECEAFLSLCGTPLTLARLEHMLTTGKPLRN